MARIPGEGLAKGLAVTFKHMVRKSVTQQYPEVHPDLPPRSRGVIALVEENCTVCMLCARECPDWCIYIDSHKETLPAPEGGRPRARNVLDRFAIDFSLCMYCGICVEVCPFDALFWAPEFEYAEYDIRDLLHEKDRLGEWVESVPPPPPHEVGAEPPKEAAAASRPARRTDGEAAGPGRSRAEGGSGRSDETARPGAAAGVSGSGPADVAATPGAAEAGAPAETSAAGTREPDAEGRTGAGRPGADRGTRARREAPRGPAAIRAIRPPGALPKRPSAPGPSGTPESPEASRPPGAPETPRPEPSRPPESPGAAGPAESPGPDSAGGGSAGRASTGEPTGHGEPPRGGPSGPESTDRESAGSGSAGGPAPSTGAESSAGREAPARREPPRALRNVRSIRPPGSLPKKDAPPDRGGDDA
ncbi:4Fe-4S binding protein [Microtetraspora fusca]|uniref:4Fe-4S binding protein n=1 Tax=Microtetraspora fusca TaxID=1997 RepID=UPI000AC524F1|nr:NADH-quinone oxidoreductase subunit I [Microtetraspora fusca]